jgi:hypothetical protein
MHSLALGCEDTLPPALLNPELGIKNQGTGYVVPDSAAFAHRVQPLV